MPSRHSKVCSLMLSMFWLPSPPLLFALVCFWVPPPPPPSLRYICFGWNLPSPPQFLCLWNLEKKNNNEYWYLWLNSICILRSPSGISIKWTPLVHDKSVHFIEMSKAIACHSLTGLNIIFHDNLFNISYCHYNQ